MGTVRWLPALVTSALATALAAGCSASHDSDRLTSALPSPTRTPPIVVPTPTPLGVPTAVPSVTRVPIPTSTAPAVASPPTVVRRRTPAPVTTTWTDTWQGWRITTRRDVARPVAGQLVRFLVTVVPPRSGGGGLTVLWGDNMGDSNPEPDCGNATFRAGNPVTVALDHAWRVGRAYTITLEPTVCGSSGGAFPRHGLEVSSGPLRGNGPLAPWGMINYGASDTGTSGAPTYVYVSGEDHDGYISRLELDWGDGTARTVLTNQSPCRRPPDDAWIQSSYAVNNVKHQYADDPAGHVIVLTVVSTGCRGENTQRQSFSWRPNRNGGSGPNSSPPPRP